MLNISSNTPLLAYNSFGIDEVAEYFAEIHNIAELQQVPAEKSPLHIIGGGSNVLLSGPVKGLVLRNCLKGITTIKEDGDHAWVEVASGEIWHQFVMQMVGANLGGIENLALIPGTAGAAPIQNIGAYGAEVKDTITEVNFWNFETGSLQTLANQQCRFGYRDSIFKHELAGKVMITSVVFRLTKHPKLNTSYGAIEQELALMNLPPTVANVAQAVISIRRSKLPDPTVTGNAGSFFKNPVIDSLHFMELAKIYTAIPSWQVGEGRVKIPAAWLIEQCGWKGYREDNYGVHSRQALVLVNFGGATGNQIWDLSGRIISSVQQKFNISLEREVQVW